jgi:CTP:molybdopterin cytidylyltransferase MocA
MGRHKALLNYNEDSTFIQRITNTYDQSGIEQIIVVVNAELFDLLIDMNLSLLHNVELVVNENPELGRFHSLQTGVQHLKPASHCFFQNIDNPFTSESLLQLMINLKDEADVIIPVFNKKSGHPVLISPSVMEEIIKSQDPELKINVFLKRFEIKKIETSDQNILVNINSPEDYQKTGNRI